MRVIIFKFYLYLFLSGIGLAGYAESNYGEIYFNKFDTLENQDKFLQLLNNFDLSNKFSGFFIGVFGKSYRKIDFYINVQKINSKTNYYTVKGKNKLDNNIKPINGYIRVTKVTKVIPNPYPREENTKDKSLHILICKYEFKEPGDIKGGGVYFGYISLVDYFDSGTKKPYNFGFTTDYSEYVKVFVGNWKNYKSKSLKKCIFTQWVCCVNELPFCKDFYYYPKDETNEGGFPRIRPEYDKYDWDSNDKSWIKD